MRAGIPKGELLIFDVKDGIISGINRDGRTVGPIAKTTVF